MTILYNNVIDFRAKILNIYHNESYYLDLGFKLSL